MKKILIICMTLFFSMSLLAPPAFAGAKQRHRWQGVAIGVGAALLGQAILNSYRDYPPPERVVVQSPPVYYHSRPRPSYNSGHWEVRKVWVPAVNERVWNPAHYDNYDEWIPGRWIMIERSPGHWQEQQVWVTN